MKGLKFILPDTRVEADEHRLKGSGQHGLVALGAGE